MSSWKYKFTPTPWTLLDYGYGYKIEPEICWIGENGRTTKEQLKANANLLLAAPDMYEALELVCEDCREGGVRNCVACAVGKAKRKARGESEGKVCKSCNNCSHVRYAYQTKKPYCIEHGIYVNEKCTTCAKFNSLDMITAPKESEAKNENN